MCHKNVVCNPYPLIQNPQWHKSTLTWVTGFLSDKPRSLSSLLRLILSFSRSLPRVVSFLIFEFRAKCWHFEAGLVHLSSRKEGLKLGGRVRAPRWVWYQNLNSFDEPFMLSKKEVFCSVLKTYGPHYAISFHCSEVFCSASSVRSGHFFDFAWITS